MFGAKPVPSIKLPTKAPMYRRLEEDMDINYSDNDLAGAMRRRTIGAAAIAIATSANSTVMAAAGTGAASASVTGRANAATRNRARLATGLIYDDVFLTTIFAAGHPEQPARIHTIVKALHASPVLAQLRTFTPVQDSDRIDSAIRLIHTEQHISKLLSSYSVDVIKIARAAVGAALAGVDAVFASNASERVGNAFVCSRPPGHHARNSGREEGFCFFNNVSIATRYAQQRYGCKRILIVDWDYHHGDGTEHFFYADGTVLLFNTYDPQAYPRSGDPARRGSGAGSGLNINFPLLCGAGDDEFVRAFEQQLIPAANRFQPDLILISCGFDSRVDDTLGCFRITDAGYVALTRIVKALAQLHCQGRVVSLLEGGYNLSGLASAAVAHLGALAEK